MFQLFILVILSWLAFYWLPTVAAVIVVGALFALFTGTRLNRAVKRGRRILAQRRRAAAQDEPVPARPPGKYDGLLALFYWRESMVHAMLLGMMAGGVFGSAGLHGGDAGAGGEFGGDFGAGGFGDMGGGDMGGGDMGGGGGAM